jgi:hypothetical protein
MKNKKYFNTTGPCIPEDHYMLNALNRLQEVIPLIDQKNYFVIHAARQSGKTTLLLEVTLKLNAEGEYYALYCSLENSQGIIEAEKGIPSIVKTIEFSVRNSNLPEREKFANGADYSDYSNVLKSSITSYCRLLDKPLVVFFDEADCLSEDTLISFLRQIRNGYNTRSQIPFVHSLALVGMRNIRDFKAKIRPDKDTLGSASPFNIVSKALTIKNFTKQEIVDLYRQHTEATGQIFEEEAIEQVYQETDGQPWLVSAIAREVSMEILKSDYTKNITADLIDESIQNIILRRDTHIDSLLERLKEERVRKVIEPIIIGTKNEISFTDDDTQYCLNLGLIKNEKGILKPANKMYAEVIIRTLSFNTQLHLQNQIENIWIDQSGIIDMDGLLKGFQEFWRENSGIWEEKYQYKEAAPHLILQAFLQRIINGGGVIHREYASDRGRLDLCVQYQNKKYPIEIKLRYSEKTYQEGLKQLGNYMDTLGCMEGWLVVFDKRVKISWSKKLFFRKKKVNNKIITIVGG